MSASQGQRPPRSHDVSFGLRHCEKMNIYCLSRPGRGCQQPELTGTGAMHAYGMGGGGRRAQLGGVWTKDSTAVWERHSLLLAFPSSPFCLHFDK
jgi:hypothetical protein